MWQLFSSTQGFLQKKKTKAVLEKVNFDDSNKRTKSDKIMMMMQALLLTIFIASFRKQSGRRMRKYGLVQPTDKQSGPYDDHPWHFWMLMMILILFYQAFFLSLIFHFWSIPLCLLWWNGFRSKTIIVNSFLIWVTFTFQHDLFFKMVEKIIIDPLSFYLSHFPECPPFPGKVWVVIWELSGIENIFNFAPKPFNKFLNNSKQKLNWFG